MTPGRGQKFGRLLGLVFGCVSASQVQAEVRAEPILEDVVVSASRQAQQAFDVPAAINAVGAQTLIHAGPQVNLSEALSRIPGIAATNRHNYAQDPQISIRGFGARAAFGVRGIKLFTDGIPASTPDGQGQASAFALTSVDRIEVLRGPLAVLYGNASGGVIQSFTRQAPETPEFSIAGYTGTYGLERRSVQLSTRAAKAGILADYSDFQTQGYRVHSAAKRSQFNVVYDLQQSDQTQWRFILNAWDQPYALDPAGLSAEQVRTNRRQAGLNTVARGVRKITSQTQWGSTLRHQASGGATWQARFYAGQRDNLQFQALGATGQWVGLDRVYYGTGLSLTQPMEIGAIPAELLMGLEADFSEEHRQSGPAVLGQKSAGLSRDEDQMAEAVNAFGIGQFFISEQYTLTAGMRLGGVRFRSQDRMATGTGPAGGSGQVRYSQLSPVVGLTRHVSPSLNIFLNYGRGFETPTLAELSYVRSDLDPTPVLAFNRSIRASKSHQAELGLKWRPSEVQNVSAVVFWVSTRDEIVTDQSAFGRSAFMNAPHTLRVGAEMNWMRHWTPHWRSSVAATLINARYQTAFRSGATPIAAGLRIPGVPSHVVFGEIAWSASPANRGGASLPPGWAAGLELHAVGRRYANDLNTVWARAFESIAVRLSYVYRWQSTELHAFARLENVLNQSYEGSVIVNNASPFEPSPLRHEIFGLRAMTRF